MKRINLRYIMEGPINIERPYIWDATSDTPEDQIYSEMIKVSLAVQSLVPWIWRGI
jgi:hypothetical protein